MDGDDTKFKEEKLDRRDLEMLAWGALTKGEASHQLHIRLNALLGAAFTRDARAIPMLLGPDALFECAAPLDCG